MTFLWFYHKSSTVFQRWHIPKELVPEGPLNPVIYPTTGHQDTNKNNHISDIIITRVIKAYVIPSLILRL